jgi:hypothetical protein
MDVRSRRVTGVTRPGAGRCSHTDRERDGRRHRHRRLCVRRDRTDLVRVSPNRQAHRAARSSGPRGKAVPIPKVRSHPGPGRRPGRRPDVADVGPQSRPTQSAPRSRTRGCAFAKGTGPAGGAHDGRPPGLGEGYDWVECGACGAGWQVPRFAECVGLGRTRCHPIERSRPISVSVRARA